MYYLAEKIMNNRLPDSFTRNAVSADGASLKVGIYFLQNGKATLDELKDKLNISSNAVVRGVQFWLDNYLISETAVMEDHLPPLDPEPAPVKKRTRSFLSHEELADAVLSNPELAILFQESQQILGRELSNSESSNLAEIFQDILPSVFAILSIESFWSSRLPGNKVVHETRFTARDWQKMGLTKDDEFEARISQMEHDQQFLREAAELLGEGPDTMTRSTKNTILSWKEKYLYGTDFIQEVLLRKPDATVPYISTVFKDWYKKGYRRIEDTRDVPVNAVSDTGPSTSNSLLHSALKQKKKR